MDPRHRTASRRLPLLITALITVPLFVLAPGAAQAAPERTPSANPRAGELQQAVMTARAAYEQAQARVQALSEQSTLLEGSAEQAEATARELHDRVAGQDDGFIQAVGDLFSSGDSALERAADAADNAEFTRRLADTTHDALVREIAAAEEARVAWERAQRRQLEVEARWSAEQAVAAAIRRSQFQASYAVTDPAQDRRNRAALRGWERYLRGLAAAAVAPPPMATVADPGRLHEPLEPVRDDRGRPQPGVAEVDPLGARSVTVLPAETIRAVAEAFHRVGLPTVPGDADPTDYACGGLIADAWATATTTVPADAAGQWRDLRAVPRDALQPGDVVVLGGRKAGLGETGVYVGSERIITADPTSGTAAVRPLPAHLLGVRRASAPTGQANPAAPAGGVCGASVETTLTGEATGPLQVPMAEGSYQLSAGFGDAGGLWSSGEHTGQDFAAPIGTPVMAAGSGTVTVQHPGWAGNLVRIDHGGGVETLYAHLSEVDVTSGQAVEAGDPIGRVGELGNATGPHLHFEVRLDGVPADPAQVLTLPGSTRPTYRNGELPADVLCPATADGAQQLRCDAAVAYRLLAAAYEQALGTPLCITDSYRSRAGQEQAFAAKPGLAAVPGTSMHGLGLAVDLCGGVERFGTTEHEWVVDHGPQFGWHHPDWAEAGGSKPEPWHFEYAGA